MCVHCKSGRSWLKELVLDGSEEEEPTCTAFETSEDDDLLEEGQDVDVDGDDAGGGPGSWSIEDDSGLIFCDEPAIAVLFETYADSHLCGECLEAVRKESAEGLGEFLEDTGLESGREYPPIDPGEPCDECGKPATHALVVEMSTDVCEEHAKRAGGG